MKIVANIAVRDEAELIGPNIEYHLSIGFHGIVIANICSTDGTTQLLEKYKNHPQVIVIPVPTQDNSVFNWNEALLKTSKEIYQPDFIAHFDADEFLYSPSHEFLASEEFAHDTLAVKLFNCVSCLMDDFRVPGSMAEIDGLTVVKRPMTTHFNQRKNTHKIPWIYTQVGPKTICKANKLDMFVDGGHAALDSNRNVIQGKVAEGFAFIHLPITSYNRFLNKVKNIESLIDFLFERTSEDYAFHWKDWAMVYRESGEQGVHDLYLQQVKAATETKLANCLAKSIDCLA